MKQGFFSAAGMVCSVLVGVTVITARAAQTRELPPQRLSFESGGRRIVADLYSPAGGESKRSVIVLHGAGGMVFDGPSMKRVARALAADGDTVYLLHYFNRTGTIGALDSTMQAHFEEWLETLRAGIAWVHQRDGAAARPLGLYGYSLGGFLAIAAASDNPLVGAVAEQAGGIWNSKEARLGKMPPVLMVHGLEDKRVPVDKYAKPLQRVVRERGAETEVNWVPGEGHVFSEAAMAKVRPKVASFFARKLPAAR